MSISVFGTWHANHPNRRSLALGSFVVANLSLLGGAKADLIVVGDYEGKTTVRLSNESSVNRYACRKTKR